MPERNQKSPQINEAWSHCVIQKGLSKLWPSAWQSRKGLRGRRNSTPFSVGGLLWLFSRLAFETLQTNTYFLCIQLTDGLKGSKKERGDKLSFVRVVGRFRLKLDSCSSASCSHQTLLLHMLAGHMPIQLAYVTGSALIGSWLRGSYCSKLLARVS